MPGYCRVLESLHLVLVRGSRVGNHGPVCRRHDARVQHQLLEAQARPIGDHTTATNGGSMLSQMFITKVAAVAAVAGLVACSTGPYRQTYWVNPGVAPQIQQHRFTLDSTECAALANQMIPEPPPPPQPQTGTISLQTPSGPVYGSYRTQPPEPQGYQPTGFLAGMQRAEREQNRRSYAVACMTNRGWQQRERIVGQ